MNARMKLAVPLMLATTATLAATGYANLGDDSIVPAPQAQQSMAPPDQAAMSAPPAEESVTVTAPRPGNDELLRNAVMDRLAGDARLSGRIGVEAYRHTVSLTGRVMSTSQVERAESLARGVDGVWDVNNYLSARVGRS